MGDLKKKMKIIRVAKSWNELNDWQLQEIAHLYVNTRFEDFPKIYLKMVIILFQKKLGFFHRLRLRKLLRKVPASALEPELLFIVKTSNYYKFPAIKGLIKPADLLGDITARHYSTIDTFFFEWYHNRSALNLRRFVAALYRIRPQFDDLDLPAVSKISRNIPVKKMELIALTYMFSREYITKSFPVVFQDKKKEAEGEKPIFKNPNKKIVPFDKVIIGMSMDERQPLGKKQDANNVRIMEFLSVMSESILIHKENNRNAK